MQFGSHVYGTNISTSDNDFKGVYIPTKENILLQRVKNSINASTNNDRNKNTSDDVDVEIFSLQKFLLLLCQGQTVAVDMIFVPDQFLKEVTPIWRTIQDNVYRFIPKNAQSFVGYCRTQANKYGIKGSRMSSVKKAIQLLHNAPDSVLRALEPQLRSLAYQDQFINMIEIEDATGEKLHLEVCNRKFPVTVKTDYVIDVLEQIYENYGQRAKQAEQNEGIDWKALMHAMRVLTQMSELFTLGHINFPCNNREYLKKIRNGEFSFKKVSQDIENGMAALNCIVAKSHLFPEEPDWKFADQLVLKYYGKTL